MAKNQNTFAKRAREMDKKRKADEKRSDRRKRKEQANNPPPAAPLQPTDSGEEPSGDSV